MSRDRWRRQATTALTAVVAATLLYYSLRDVDLRGVMQIAVGANPRGLLLVAGIGILTLLLRALRWGILLNAQGTVGLGTAFWATAAGYFGNNVLPARAGELVRTYMISSRSSLDATFVLTTALTERIVDAVVLVAIASMILLSVPLRLGWLAGAVKPVAVLGLLAALGILILPLLESVGKTALGRARLSESLRRRLVAMMEQCLRGLRTYHDGRRLLGFLALTAVIWCMDAFATIVGGAAIGLDIPIAAAFLLLAALGMASALPSPPGYVGVYQFAAVSALTPFGFSRTDAIAYVLVFQVLMVIVVAGFGSVGLLEYRRARPDTSGS
jgi:glycosyltransferase 2 family protein